MSCLVAKRPDCCHNFITFSLSADLYIILFLGFALAWRKDAGTHIDIGQHTAMIGVANEHVVCPAEEKPAVRVCAQCLFLANSSIAIIASIIVVLVVLSDGNLDTLTSKDLGQWRRLDDTRELLCAVNLEFIRERPGQDRSGASVDGRMWSAAHADIDEAHAKSVPSLVEGLLKSQARKHT